MAKAALHTVHIAKGKAKGKAKFQVGPDAEVSRDIIVLLGGAHGAVVRDSTPTPRSRRRWGGVGDGGFPIQIGGGSYTIRILMYLACILHVSCMYFDVSRS